MNPVLQALANAREQEREREHAIVANAVAARLGIALTQGDKSQWPVWQAWCKVKGTDAFPTRPHVLACWILENAALGIDQLNRVVESVSAMHAYCSDPALSPLVSAALATVAPIQPPRGWPLEHKTTFTRLPRDLQTFVAAHERKIEIELRKAQNNAKKDSKHGIHQQKSPAAAGNADAALKD